MATVIVNDPNQNHFKTDSILLFLAMTVVLSFIGKRLQMTRRFCRQSHQFGKIFLKVGDTEVHFRMEHPVCHQYGKMSYYIIVLIYILNRFQGN